MRVKRGALPFRRPSSNRDGRCLRSLTPSLRFLDSALTVLRRGDDALRSDYRFQLQMPPVRHGQVWMRVSIARASSGLPWRWASFVRATPRGGVLLACATLGSDTCTRSAATFFGTSIGS